MEAESQWVTFRVGVETFAVQIESVQEMLRLPNVYRVPGGAPDAMGVFLLRDKIVPIFDLRVRFGLPNCCSEVRDLVALLHERLADHERWLTELETSIAEKREFTLATNPHECKFGRWYDTFKSKDIWLMSQLGHFDAPHKKIHALGAEILALQHQGKYDECEQHVKKGRESLLKELAVHFHKTIELVKERGRQSVIVLGTPENKLGVAVDDISQVVRCQNSDIQPPDKIDAEADLEAVIGLLPQAESERLIILLDPVKLYPQLAGATAEPVAIG